MTTLASRVRAYIDGLVVTQGYGAGGAFEVLPWQARFIRGSLAPDVGEAALTVARGAGKSTLCAGIAAAFLDGEGIAAPASEVTVVSPTLKQSRRVFLHVVRFLEAQGRIGGYRKWDSPNVCSLESRIDGRRLECLGANPGGLHGAAPSLVLADEVAQYPHLRVDAMLAAIRTGLGKTPHSRLVMLGTRAATKSHPFSLALRTADYVQVHAAGDGDPEFRKRTWAKANPSLRYFPDLEAATRRDAKSAKASPEMLAAFRALRLNLGVADTMESLLLEAATWEAAEGDAPREGRPVWGVDLGGSAASSAVAAYWPDSGRLEAVAAFPSRPTLAERGLGDGVGRLYIASAERGELLALGDRAVLYVALVREALERFGRPTAVAADRWRAAELKDALDGATVRCRVDLRGQGFKDGADDVRRFRRLFAEGAVTPVRSLFLASCVAGARTVHDVAGNSKLAKSTEGGRRLNARDDAAAAAILAVSLASRRPAKRTGGL